MNVFALNVVLALGWVALVGSFSPLSLLAGFLIAYGALWVVRPLFGATTYFERLWRVVQLVGLFVYELIVSSLRVAWDVVTPTHLSRPGIIAVPLDVDSDAGILLVASLISLTPGSLSLDLSADRKTLYVHAMFVDDPAVLRRRLKHGMERRIIEALA